MKRNNLNALDSKTWLKFQKSWFIHNPPPRQKEVLLHPAKFPETLAREFIEFFTKPGEMVLDPMVGTGSTLIACLLSGRGGFGVELNAKYAKMARAEVKNYRRRLDYILKITPSHPLLKAGELELKVLTADALHLSKLKLPIFDYCITSPPYWDMLRMKGAKTQQKRREGDLDVAYSDDTRDVGNLADYDQFLAALTEVYRQVHGLLRDKAYLTIIVKNVKKKGKIYPLAWDLGREVGKFFTLKDEKIWCQADQRLAPYGLGNAWVSNTLHHYCLNFRKEG
jgi:DNA modification methylase